MPLFVGETLGVIHGRLSTARHVQLLEDVAEVIADRLVAEIQRRGDLFIGEALCDQRQDPPFLRRQRIALIFAGSPAIECMSASTR